jgi:hypothetical protein
MPRKAPILVTAAGLVVACASLPSAQRTKVEIRPGGSESQLTVNGIIHQYETGHHYLRSRVDLDQKSVRHELFVSSRVTEPNQTFARAEGQGEASLEVFPIDSKWLGCPHGFCSWAIEWGIEFPDEVLRANLGGYSLTGFTTSGSEVEIEVTPAQIWDQLAAVDSLLVWGKGRP